MRLSHLMEVLNIETHFAGPIRVTAEGFTSLLPTTKWTTAGAALAAASLIEERVRGRPAAGAAPLTEGHEEEEGVDGDAAVGEEAEGEENREAAAAAEARGEDGDGEDEGGRASLLAQAQAGSSGGRDSSGRCDGTCGGSSRSPLPEGAFGNVWTRGRGCKVGDGLEKLNALAQIWLSCWGEQAGLSCAVVCTSNTLQNPYRAPHLTQPSFTLT